MEGQQAQSGSPVITSEELQAEYDRLNIPTAEPAKGVKWIEARKKWLAQACYKGKKYNLGRFEDKEDAVEVYQNFRKTFPDGRRISGEAGKN